MTGSRSNYIEVYENLLRLAAWKAIDKYFSTVSIICYQSAQDALENNKFIYLELL